ncbi:MAG: hypothetical protein IKB07_09030 [Lachnospiraceae bacterium]|nr:hypothetical protein [Lachnospiraceae bacterium]
MSVQVLMATMHQQSGDISLLEKTNIQTDALIGNQCEQNSIEEMNWNNHKIVFFNFKEKGVGLNRNNTLMRANGDFLLFADDDMVYVDGYEKIIEKYFTKYKDADMLIFNINEPVPRRYITKRVFRVKWYNFMRFGTVRIAVRRKSIFYNGILYNLSFGGGTEFQDGDDTLFLCDCVKKGLKIYAIPEVIATLTEERESTWFKGYDDCYLVDKGVLFWAISHRYYKLLCLQDVLRHSRIYGRGKMECYKKMVKGIQEKINYKK